jgi:uncharacterized protein DUF3237
MSAPDAPVPAGPASTIETEYLMTMQGTVGPPRMVDGSLAIYLVEPGGTVAGPRIKGRIVAPTADWSRLMPSGVARLDVRGAIETDDGALVYFSYNGIVHFEAAAAERLAKGEVLHAGECYFVTAPTFETGAEKYAWLNRVQAVGKTVALKAGEGGYVKFDIFAVT